MTTTRPRARFEIFTFLVVLALGACSGGPGPSDVDAGGVVPADGGRVDSGADASVPGCGDGVLQSTERCDPAYESTVDPSLGCDCDDGDACTIDACAVGTSAAACDCECEHADGRGTHGVGTCDDADPCTIDVARCTDPADTRAVAECAAACTIACDNSEIAASCMDICGNGVINPGETCEVFVPGVSPDDLPLCGCDDGDSCTADTVVSGDAATCDLVCSSAPYEPDTYGVNTCDDGLTCTTDMVLGGVPATCDVLCMSVLTAGWDAAACDDGDACTSDAVLTSDPATCAVTCESTPLVGYPYPPAPGSGLLPCDDGIACTSDAVVRFDSAACRYECTHGGLSGYPYTTCDDGNACTIDTQTGGSAASCSMTCSHRNVSADPDPIDLGSTFADTNCDGVDGVASQMVFVAPTGSDSSTAGTRTLPFRTIQYAISMAGMRGISDIAVSAGTYEHVALSSGVSLHGGYDRALGWSRSASAVTHIAGNGQFAGPPYFPEGMLASNIDRLTRVNRFTIQSPGYYNVGQTAYGIRVISSSLLELHNVGVTALPVIGGGGSLPGTTGFSGRGGGRDTGTVQARRGGYGTCPGQDETITWGGWGGVGGTDTVSGVCSGASWGAPGDSWRCGAGYGGDPAEGCGTDPAGAGGNGWNCEGVGATGTPGAAITARGSVIDGLWVQANANPGTSGTPGVGGGGGGGGGSGNCDTYCQGGDGGDGGGGGGGGCGGGGGGGGQGARGSFGLFVIDSTITIVGSTFASSTAGNGGVGGNGGSGGAGGAGSVGDPGGGIIGAHPLQINARWGANGGRGGDGQRGGAGGGGSGGPGGVSIAQFLCRSTVVNASASTGSAPATAASGGAGGLPNGVAGPPGIASPYLVASGASCAL